MPSRPRVVQRRLELREASMATLLPGNDLKGQFVYQPSPGAPHYVTGLVTGYKEGDTASMAIQVVISPAEVGTTFEFGIVLDLSADATPTKYAFDGLTDY